MSDNTLEIIKKLQDSQKSIKITIGSIIGVVFILFFFTFAMLVDKAPPIFFEIETVLVIILFPMLFMLNRISFAILKFRKGKKEEFKDVLTKMDRNDVDKKPEKVLEGFQ